MEERNNIISTSGMLFFLLAISLNFEFYKINVKKTKRNKYRKQSNKARTIVNFFQYNAGFLLSIGTVLLYQYNIEAIFNKTLSILTANGQC